MRLIDRFVDPSTEIIGGPVIKNAGPHEFKAFARKMPAIDISMAVPFADSMVKGGSAVGSFFRSRLPFAGSYFLKFLTAEGSFEAVVLAGEAGLGSGFFRFQWADEAVAWNGDKPLCFYEGMTFAAAEKIFVFLGCFGVATTEDGAVVSAFASDVTAYHVGGMPKDVAQNCLASVADAFLTSLEIMHAKTHVRVVDSAVSDKQRRAFQKRHKRPMVRYRVLEIDGSIAPKHAKRPGESADRAHHMCRGHFKTFTGENKLFGRLTGTFFVPAHVRGNKAAGQVVKDYVIAQSP